MKEKIAQPLGLSVTEAALGILRIGAAAMSHAVKGVTTDRGLDPGAFPNLFAYGGAGPLHASMVARDGYSKADVKKFIYEHGRVRLDAFSDENIDRRIRQWPVFKGEFTEAGPDRMVPVMKSATNAHVVVIGGAGKHSAYVPTFGATQPITRALKLRGGAYAKSVEEFRQK